MNRETNVFRIPYSVFRIPYFVFSPPKKVPSPPLIGREGFLLDGALRCVGTTTERLPREPQPSLQWRFGFQTLSFQNPHRPPLNQNRSCAVPICARRFRRGAQVPTQSIFCASRVLCGQPTNGLSRPQSGPVKARKPSVSAGGREASQRTSHPPRRADARTGDGRKRVSKELAADARATR